MANLAQLVSFAPYHVTRMEPAEKQITTLPTLLHTVLLTGFYLSFMQKGTKQSIYLQQNT